MARLSADFYENLAQAGKDMGQLFLVSLHIMATLTV